jgi:tRNA(fMet)-specific endonuclease VapC
MTVADTDVLIDFLAGVNPGAARVAAELERGSLHTTAINRFELLAGARTARQQASIRQLLAVIPTLPVDEAAADRAADVKRALERGGKPIGLADCLIAGITLAHGALLLTRNRRHFERIEALKLAENE